MPPKVALPVVKPDWKGEPMGLQDQQLSPSETFVLTKDKLTNYVECTGFFLKFRAYEI